MNDVGTSINKCLTWYIRTLLRHPKVFIIVPLLIMYVIGYPTNYDFTVKILNQFINNIHFPSPKSLDLSPTNLIGFKNGYKYDYDFKTIIAMKNSDLKDFSLSRLSFGSDNVMNMDFLRSTDQTIKNYLSLTYGPTIVVSPIYDMKIDLQADYPDSFMPYIVNHYSSLLMESLYYKDLHFVNQMFHSAKIINIYFIHNSSEPIDESKFAPYLTDVTTITSANSIYDFINYILLLNRQGLSKYVNIFLNWLVIILLLYFIFTFTLL